MCRGYRPRYVVSRRSRGRMVSRGRDTKDSRRQVGRRTNDYHASRSAVPRRNNGTNGQGDRRPVRVNSNLLCSGEIVHRRKRGAFPTCSVGRNGQGKRPGPPTGRRASRPAGNYFIPDASVASHRDLTHVNGAIRSVKRGHGRLRRRYVGDRGSVTLSHAHEDGGYDGHRRAGHAGRGVTVRLRRAARDSLVRNLVPTGAGVRPLPVRCRPRRCDRPRTSVLDSRHSHHGPLRLRTRRGSRSRTHRSVRSVLNSHGGRQRAKVLRSSGPAKRAVRSRRDQHSPGAGVRVWKDRPFCLVHHVR